MASTAPTALVTTVPTPTARTRIPCARIAQTRTVPTRTACLNTDSFNMHNTDGTNYAKPNSTDKGCHNAGSSNLDIANHTAPPQTPPPQTPPTQTPPTNQLLGSCSSECTRGSNKDSFSADCNDDRCTWLQHRQNQRHNANSSNPKATTRINLAPATTASTPINTFATTSTDPTMTDSFNANK